MFIVAPSSQPVYRPGTSVVLADTPSSPVMTILRCHHSGPRAWYVVAWLDHHSHRHEACLSEDQLLAASPALPS